MMSKTKLLTVLVVILVVLNVITLSFFVFKKPHDRLGIRKMPSEIVIDKLNFDTEQIAKYEVLIKEHSQAITTLDHQLKAYKNNLYKQLSQSNTYKLNDTLFLNIASTQAAIEKLHFNHFLAIKKLCRPEQIENYNSLTNELSKIFSRQPLRENLNRG